MIICSKQFGAKFQNFFATSTYKGWQHPYEVKRKFELQNFLEDKITRKVDMRIFEKNCKKNKI